MACVWMFLQLFLNTRVISLDKLLPSLPRTMSHWKSAGFLLPLCPGIHRWWAQADAAWVHCPPCFSPLSSFNSLDSRWGAPWKKFGPWSTLGTLQGYLNAIVSLNGSQVCPLMGFSYTVWLISPFFYTNLFWDIRFWWCFVPRYSVFKSRNIQSVTSQPLLSPRCLPPQFHRFSHVYFCFTHSSENFTAIFFERMGTYFSQLLGWSLNHPHPFSLLLMFFIFFSKLCSLCMLILL